MTTPTEVSPGPVPRVGVIGLGNLGLPMALRLAETQVPVLAVEVSHERRAVAQDAGVTLVDRPADLHECDVVCVCVVDDDQVRDVVAGPEGVARHLRTGTTVMVHSTVFPSTVTALAGELGPWGVAVLDAPVSGGDHGARAGTLAIMVGGEDADVSHAGPVLDVLGEHVFHLGPLGSGLAVKFANQLMTFANQAAALEAVALARAFGVAEDRVVEVAQAGTADSWCLRNWGFFDRVASEYEASGAAPANRPWRKDLWDVVTVARQLDLSMPLAGVLSQVAAPRIDERGRRD
ncbi:NAD(P)-dependent oxidoreductase [Spiractinospora alimapuensis]|uniref:NAD(P)-dependent oxidoreductase n=1 Tax=Spiractinospora alimapuensis TaxID=2820884 RepID=UPI001F2B0859|nr:NAD(P)-dependent oxidoreductase [Spiractinospora alimapuensis]QVQ50051.1 NAD(P)-dependent oxidoreductase [Spiractinospora alimapuensis]